MSFIYCTRFIEIFFNRVYQALAFFSGYKCRYNTNGNININTYKDEVTVPFILILVLLKFALAKEGAKNKSEKLNMDLLQKEKENNKQPLPPKRARRAKAQDDFLVVSFEDFVTFEFTLSKK